MLQKALHLYEDGIFWTLTDEAVRAFQKRNGLVVDGIVGQQTWQALGITDLYSVKKSKRIINEIIVHCSATPEGRDVTTAEIKQWHLARGFSDIGYHYVVYRNGDIREGRNVDISGAHCTGHNQHSIGVCSIGGLAKDGKTPKDTRTDKQREALAWLLKGLKDVYPKAIIHGHNEFAAKACPCFNAYKEYKNIK